MSYQALARTWRPRSFEDLVGQEHVVKALVHALDDDRLHHAYLFTGTRGVGKTTIARILAKCLNCEQGVSSKPCGECSACTEIDEGRFVDLLEVDAASRTKVDDTRELLDNVQYTPTRGRYKVYLIDEVHMLSGHSFNALLKTLEEPPPHVKFLLATTDPQKLPVTVLSRCLQFNLKRLPVSLIEPRLEVVTGAEEMSVEPGALGLLARAADGSMRDALSLLDQAAAYCQGKLTDAEVRAMLGTIDQQHAVRLLEYLAAGDAPALLAEVATLDERVPDYVAALDEVPSLTQRVAIAQVAGVADDDERGDVDTIRALADQIPAEDLQLYYQIALIGKRDLHLAPSQRAGFEMVLLRMATFRPADTPAPGGSAPPPATRRGAAAARATLAQASGKPPGRSERAGADRDPAGMAAADRARSDAAGAHRPAGRTSGGARAVSTAGPARETSASAERNGRVNGMHKAAAAPGASAPAGSRSGARTGPGIAEEPAAGPADRIEAAPTASSDSAGAADLPSGQDAWNELVGALGLKGAARQFAGSCHLDGADGDVLHLTLDSARQHLYTDTLRDKLGRALADHFGRAVRVQIEIGEVGAETLAQRRDREAAERQREAVAMIAKDPNVAALKETFGATVDESSIRPR